MVFSKMFIGEEEVVVNLTVAFDKETGEFKSAFDSTFEKQFELLKDKLMIERFEFRFSKPNYNTLNGYRQSSSEFNPVSQTKLINPLKLRDFFLVFHLKGWNVKDNDGNDIELKFEENGALTDESMDIIYKLHPSIIDQILNAYERKATLV